MIGINYEENEKHSGYRQALYQLTTKAAKGKYSKLWLGMDASTEKRKIGAKVIGKSIYVQANDNFNMELMSTLNQNESGI